MSHLLGQLWVVENPIHVLPGPSFTRFDWKLWQLLSQSPEPNSTTRRMPVLSSGAARGHGLSK